MPALGITDLPWPLDKFRVDLHDSAFETDDDAAAEDAKRAKLLRKQAAQHGGDWGFRCGRLADRLDPAFNPEFPASPASSRYMRDPRIRIPGQLWRLFDEDRTGQVVRYDVVKPGLIRDLEGLLDESPKRATNELRSDILRGAQGPHNGFLFASYHNEFDNLSQLFQGHFHLLVSGDYVDLVERMRKLKGYRPTEIVRTPILAHRTITNPAHALTYLVKSYWSQRPFLPLGANGTAKRPRNGQRLDEPYHSEVLLWLDRWTLADLTLLLGMRVNKHGLVLTS